MTLSVVMVTENSANVVEGAMRSVKGIAGEVLVGDGGSTDGTVEIVKKYGGRIVAQWADVPLGIRKQELVEKAKGPARNATHSVAGGEWILVMDADERVSEELGREIGRLGERKMGGGHGAYRIPYQNYVFGKPVYYGGERYAKVRLFRRGYARVSPEPLHEEIIINKNKKYSTLDPRLRGDDNFVGNLRGVIHHYSYRTPWQLFTKFTRYAWIAAREKKWQGATLTVKKLFLYGPHMFYARFIKERGYKDGWRGLILALAFGYMEGLTYWFAFIRQIFTRPPLAKAKGVAFKTL